MPSPKRILRFKQFLQKRKDKRLHIKAEKLKAAHKVKLRCCGHLHTVAVIDKHVVLVNHDKNELRTETAFRTMVDAPPPKCFDYIMNWKNAYNGKFMALPEKLRGPRSECLSRKSYIWKRGSAGWYEVVKRDRQDITTKPDDKQVWKNICKELLINAVNRKLNSPESIAEIQRYQPNIGQIKIYNSTNYTNYRTANNRIELNLNLDLWITSVLCKGIAIVDRWIVLMSEMVTENIWVILCANITTHIVGTLFLFKKEDSYEVRETSKIQFNCY